VTKSGALGIRRCQRGFTIAELVTSILVFALVGAAITSVIAGSLNSVSYQARMSDALLDAATAMALTQDDLRAAGYVTDNMNQTIFQQAITGTTADSIQFVGDVNSDGISERITYALGSGSLMRTQDTWDAASQSWVTGTAQPVATNVTAFTLKFFRVDPCTAVITQQTAAQVTGTGLTTFVSIALTATGTYKGQTVTRSLMSDVAGRQDNVLPKCV